MLPHKQNQKYTNMEGRADGRSDAERLSRQKERNITWLEGQSSGEDDLKPLFDVRHIFDGLEAWH